jgi:hypothetical protein
MFVDTSGVVGLSQHRVSRAGKRAAPEGELRLISRCARPFPRPDTRPTAERKSSFMYGAEPHFSGYRPRAWSDGWQEEELPGTASVRTAA